MTANVSRTKAALSPLPEQRTHSSTLTLTLTLTLAHSHTRIWSSQSKDNYEPHLLGMLVYCQSRVNTNQLRHCQSTEWEKQRETKRERERGRLQERCSSGNCCHMTFDLASHWRIYNLKQVANKADERPSDRPTERRKRSCVQMLHPTHTYTLATYIHTCIRVCVLYTRLVSGGHANINRVYGRCWQRQLNIVHMYTGVCGVCVCVCVCVGVSVSAGVCSVLCLHCAINSVEISALPEVIKTIITA